MFGSRLRALCRLSKLGLYFTTEKQEAILHGDISNAVVDRHFVYALQTLGVHICGVPEESPAMIWLQARYVQTSLETLVQLCGSDRERTKAQALLLTVQTALLIGFTILAQLHLLKACKIIERAKLRYVPEHGRPADLSDQVREEVSVLSQAIFLENYLFLAFNGPAPVRTAGFEREFRFDLQVRSI